MNSKNRITYRFDRAGKSINDESREATDIQQGNDSKETASNKTTNENSLMRPHLNVVQLYNNKEHHTLSEVNPWNSPFQEDIGALEQLIRDTDSKKGKAVHEQTEANDKQEENTDKGWSDARSIRSYDRKLRNSIQVEPLISNTKQQRNIGHTIADTTEHNIDDILDYIPDAAKNIAHEILIENDELEPSHSGKLAFGDLEPKAYKTSQLRRSSRGPSWFNVFLSVAGALATGALFGYLLLSLFTGAAIWPGGSKDKLESKPAINNNVNAEKEPGTNPNEITKIDDVVKLPMTDPIGKEEASTEGPMVSLAGLDKTYYFLQFGVFSNTEGRDIALDQLAEKGLAAASMKTAEDYRVYAGMSTDRSEAVLIRGQLSEMDLYIKEMSIASPKQIPFDGDAASAQAFFEQTNKLVQILDELVVAQLEQPSLSPVGKTAAEAWQQEYQQWTENAATMRSGTKDAASKTYLDKVLKSMNTAAKSMLEYDKKPSRAHLWSTQSAIMEAIITQKQWFESISAL